MPQGAADRVDAINTLKAITICITTRSIGFGVVGIFEALLEFEHVPIRGTIYQFYRVGLAVCEAKVQIVQRSVSALPNNEEDYYHHKMSADYLEAARTVACLPDQLSSPLNAIGKVKLSDRVYIPKIGKMNYTQDNRFVPQSEQVVLSNLRETVLAMSDLNVDQRYRARFARNCAIPGAIWINTENNGPVLQNADEIMPPDYNHTALNDDIQDIRGKVNFLNKKAPKYFTKDIAYGPEGGKSLLVCNEQNGMKICDRLPNEQLPDYYGRVKVEGNIEEYYNLERLTTGEQIDGSLCLLGEYPATFNLRYPVYSNRDARSCVEVSSLKYKAAKTMKYTWRV